MGIKKEQETENPQRISQFLKATSEIDWVDGTSDSWKQVFIQCTGLIKCEIEYYYKSRMSSRRTSFWFRLFALVFGTAGFLAPLLDAAGIKGAGPFGYLLLALSAACFAANSLFGGTSGHTRYVVAQINLEKTLTLMVIEWSKLIGNNASIEEKADFIKEKMSQVYSIILEETDVWGEALAQAVEAYEKKVTQKPEILS